MLTENEQSLLLYLVEHGPKTQYTLEKEMIPKNLFSSKGTISHLLGKLVEKSVIEIKTPEIAQVRPKKPHHPTMFGLAYAVEDAIHNGPSSVFWDKRRFQNLIEHNRDLLPLVLGKWDVFVEEGVEENAIHRFWLSCRYLVEAQPTIMRESPDPQEWNPALLKRTQHPNPEYQSDWFTTPLDEIFTAYFYNHSIVSVRKERWRTAVERAVENSNKRWTEVCASDPEIYDFVSNSWKLALDSYSHTVGNLEKALELLISSKNHR